MTFTAEHMKNYVEGNPLVQVKEQVSGLLLLKYKNKVFYKNLWTPELCELRGTVVDHDYNIIQRTPTKIFNRGEKKAPNIHRDTKVTAVRKINGFMAAATYYQDPKNDRDSRMLVSSTGSLLSDYVAMATEALGPSGSALARDYPDYSFTFEITTPADPHVVPEKEGAWLLLARKKTWDSPQHAMSEQELDNLAAKYGFLRPEWHMTTFGDIVKQARAARHEGYVVWDADGNEVKLKTPYYLVTKFFGRKSAQRIQDIIDNPEMVHRQIDEEYYPVIDFVVENKETFVIASEQERFAMVREFIQDMI